MKPTRLTLSVLLALSAIGCASTPSPILLEGSTAVFAQAPEKDIQVSGDWWGELQDPILDKLVTAALSGNLSLKAAAERLSAAARIEDAAPFAVMPGTAVSATRNKSDVRPTGVSALSSRAAFSVSWEAPLFGKLEATLASAKSQHEQAVWQVEASKVSLAAAVVRGYAQFQTNQIKLKQMHQAVGLASEALELQQASVEAGLLHKQDAESALKQVLQYKAQLAQLQSENRQIRDSLAVLCGETNLDLLDEASSWKEVTPLIRAADPARLRERPDVRAAEAGVMTAAAQVGLAKANLWPQLNLATAVNISPGSGALVSNNGSLGLSMPLLSWFTLKAQADASVSQMKASVEDYRQTVLNAWQEAQAADADAMSAMTRTTDSDLQREIVRNQTARVKAMESAGLSSRLERLNAQLVELTQEMATADERSQLIQNWARLQKASFVSAADLKA